MADRCKKTDSSRNRPERNKWIDYLLTGAKQGLSADLSPPESGQKTTGSPPLSARALSVSPAADLTTLRPTERGIAGVNRPAEARPGRMRDPSHRHQAFFDTVFAQKIGGLFGILKFVRIFAHAFDTKAVTNDGAIAQLVEQRTENPCVPGSIPGGTTPNYSDLQQCKSLFHFTKAHNLHTRFFVSFAKKRRASGRKEPEACISARMRGAKKQRFQPAVGVLSAEIIIFVLVPRPDPPSPPFVRAASGGALFAELCRN